MRLSSRCNEKKKLLCAADGDRAEEGAGQSKRHDASRKKESGCLRRARDQKLLKNENLITYYPLDS